MEPTIAVIDPTALAMAKPTPIRVYRKTWDSDRALKSTYKGLFGKYQIRAYILLALGYGVTMAWLAKMPAFALLPPKSINCTPYYLNTTNEQQIGSMVSSGNNSSGLTSENRRRLKPMYNYSKEYGRSVLTDFDTLCDKTRIKAAYAMYLSGLILGGLVFGYIADFGGRKMVLLGSIWTTCAISVFQLLSEDYISYIFFILFIGITIGAVQVITVPFVMEMFPTRLRAYYGLILLGAVFLLDLVIPWLALAIKHWKILQAVVTVPLVITAALYWFVDETIFWHTSQKDFVEAILSLKKIAKYNQVVFEDVFREAGEFLRGKCSKGVQCDFQPLLRLEDISTLGSKYPDFDMIDLQTTSSNKATLSKRIAQVLSGHHYNPRLSTFYPTDFLHSSILTIYLLIMCALWLVSGLLEYSLDAPQITQHLTDNFFRNYFYTHLIQIVSLIVAFPLVVFWGRRWPTFCFFLIAEVCLLGSVAVKLDTDQEYSGMLAVYFLGKFASHAVFLVLVIFTCEIFPTGLRCTALGICYTFRLIGMAIASPDLGELNDWMHRLIYGVLALVLGSMALLLPETKKVPLPRTMLQVESITTGISKTFRRRRRPTPAKPNVKSDEMHHDEEYAFSDNALVLSDVRYSRQYDPQSTLHSIDELQDFTHDDAIHSIPNRYSTRRTDLRSGAFYQPYPGAHGELYKQESIAEAAEYTDEMDDDQMQSDLRQHIRQQKQVVVAKRNVPPTDDVIVVPDAIDDTSFDKPPVFHFPSENQTEGDVNKDRRPLTKTAPISIITDEKEKNSSLDYGMSSSPRYQRTMSQDENYFSEHC